MSRSSKAIVLSVEDFGEADCYVQFFTQKWGMISALAKSAKKSKRRYIGGLDLFCHDEIFLRGDPKERPYLQELTVLNSFQGLRNELEKMLAAGKAANWVKKLANISTPLPQVYSLLGQTLSLIETEPNRERYELLILIFKIKLLSYLGLKPRMDSCVKCSSQDSERAGIFDISQGGFTCSECLPAGTHENSRITIQERSFLDLTDELKLTLWDKLEFPLDRVGPLQRTVTQFATYHTHTRLP